MMLASTASAERPSATSLVATQDIAGSPRAAFAYLCEIEKWPVWLTFLRSARRVDDAIPFGLGSEVEVRSGIPGEPEDLYEVDRFLDGHIVSLVGAFSTRRRIDFRIEEKTGHSKLSVRIDYPSYGGVLGALVDRLTARRKLEAKLADSLLHFKSLVEFKDGDADATLSDF